MYLVKLGMFFLCFFATSYSFIWVNLWRLRKWFCCHLTSSAAVSDAVGVILVSSWFWSFLPWRLFSSYHILCSKKTRVSPKLRVLPSETLSAKKYPQDVDRLSLFDKVARSVSVKLSWQYLRRSTDELGQFITLSVHLCVQHDAREAAWRPGPGIPLVIPMGMGWV